MKEGRIILPTGSRSAGLDTAILLAFQMGIAATFGGATISDGRGYWKGETEPILIVDVAYEPTWDNDAKLYDIARKFLDDAKQESVYVRYANGNVQFVTALSCMDNGEKEPFDWDRLRADMHEPPDDLDDVIKDDTHETA